MGWLTAPLGITPEDPGYTGTFAVKFIHASLTDVNGSGTVIVGSESALRTDIFMPLPVPCIPVNVTAVRTGLAGMPWIHIYNHDTLCTCLVLDLVLKIMIRP